MAEFSDANSFLMGGGGAPSAKFPQYGTTVAGRITEPPTMQQQRDYTTGDPKFWSDGNPAMQLVVTVQTEQRDPSITDDDGKRRLFVRGALKAALQQAVANAQAQGLEVGGHLSVTYTHDGEKTGNLNPPKQYRAEYISAANMALRQPTPAAPPPGVNGQTGEVVNPQAYAQAAAPAPAAAPIPIQATPLAVAAGMAAPTPATYAAPPINPQTGQPWTAEQIEAMTRVGIPIPGMPAPAATGPGY